MKRNGSFYIAAVLTAVYWCLICLLTHWPEEQSPLRFPDADKYAHFGVFFGLAMLGRTVILLSGRYKHARWMSAALLIALAGYAAADELTQPFFGRSAAWLDWAADVAGAATGIVVLGSLQSAGGRLCTAAAAVFLISHLNAGPYGLVARIIAATVETLGFAVLVVLFKQWFIRNHGNRWRSQAVTITATTMLASLLANELLNLLMFSKLRWVNVILNVSAVAICMRIVFGRRKTEPAQPPTLAAAAEPNPSTQPPRRPYRISSPAEMPARSLMLQSAEPHNGAVLARQRDEQSPQHVAVAVGDAVTPP